MRSAALLLVASVLVSAGCGETDRLSRAELRARANATCRQFERDLVHTPGGLTENDLAAIIKANERRAAALSNLRPPKADEERWTRYLALVNQATQRWRELRTKVIHGQSEESLLAADAHYFAHLAYRGDQIEDVLGLGECDV